MGESSLSKTTTALHTLHLGMEWFPEHASGLNRYFSELISHLPAVGVAAHGLVLGSPAVTADSGGRVQAVGSTGSPFPARWYWWRRGIARALAADQDVLPVAHFALYAFAALDLLAPRGMVIHFHGPWALEAQEEGARPLTTGIRVRLERQVYRRGTVLIALSSSFGRLLERVYGVDGARIRIIPGGVNTVRFAVEASRVEARCLLGWPTDRPILLSVRRLVRRMGLENLLIAAGEVRRRIPEVLFLLAGVGPLADELRRRIAAAGLENHVRLLGRLADERLPLAYRGADATVLPSVGLEGFGLTAVESLAAGTPILATPVGGLPEVLGDLSSDLLFTHPEPPHLTTGIVDFLRGRLAVPDAATCQAYARSRFDWKIIAQRVAAVYAEALR